MLNIEFESIFKDLFKERFKKKFPLSQYTSFRCGGDAEYLVFPKNIDEVSKAIKLCNEFKKNFLILGKGTNVLVSDEGFEGLVISTLMMKNYSISDDKIICEAGLKLSELLNICISNSLSGIEFLAGIPGTVGGAVKNNAGLKEEWTSEKLIYVEYLDYNLNIFKKEKEEINFDYRKTGLNNVFIWNCAFKLRKEKKEEIKRNIKENMEKRIKTQPVGKYCAGSIFKNPYPYYAGELIEKAGLKGYSVGNCYISFKHANFIINKGGGKAKEVYELIKIIKERVKEKFEIDLELEIQLIGEF